MQFTLKSTFNTTAKELYLSWLNSENHSKMTGGLAECSDSVGGSFTAWDGYIWGKNIELEPFHRIVQSWRTTQFNDNEKDSQIEILLKELNDGQTELTLIHTNLPESGEHYKKGWEDHYFEPMKAFFG
ncbi:SRPBCC domain-containing protein [Hyunsoonleella sp. SJ7]|uniref:SRPBCC domain-containing protein n=1 Tax=Hyunsoonleella aquatilis TaxID=2762758 RepID=A0A923KIY8_9FLAO|nr:SRPBCC domain-containing protein [Hyunsoonleella aquatilis]MBC3759414.1 SRPBCC domain-containing protein [Hyunsoonleella aquatilis]